MVKPLKTMGSNDGEQGGKVVRSMAKPLSKY